MMGQHYGIMSAYRTPTPGCRTNIKKWYDVLGRVKILLSQERASGLPAPRRP